MDPEVFEKAIDENMSIGEVEELQDLMDETRLDADAAFEI